MVEMPWCRLLCSENDGGRDEKEREDAMRGAESASELEL